MAKRLLLVLGMWGLLAASPAVAQEADLGEQVARLVEQLDAMSLADREAAEKELSALGPKVLAHLPTPNRRMAAEQRQRLERVRQKLESASAEAATRPTQVTLSGEDLPLSEVLAEIQRQTGNTIVDFREQVGQQTAELTVSVDFQETPFWEAMDQLLDETGLTIYGYGGEGQLALVSAMAAYAPRGDTGIYSGPFRFEPVELEARRNLRSDQGALLRLRLEASWEPRLIPIALQQATDALSAQDDLGNTLTLLNAGRDLEIPVVPNSSIVEMEVPFELPSREATEIAEIKGSLNALLLGERVKFRFDNLAGARKVVKKKGKVEVVLENVRRNNLAWEVQITTRFQDAYSAFESHRGWVFQNPAYLEDAQGERENYGSLNSTGRTADSAGAAYLFLIDGDIDDYTFVYETPAAVFSLPVDYELKNLKLP